MAPEDLWPPSAFWDFSLATYARPGVADACLALQEELGVDVNLLLLACWLARQGRRPGAELAARLRDAAAAHQDPIVRPLRAARRALKARLARVDPALAGPLGQLRRAVAAAELAAERAEQLELGLIAGAEPAGGAPAHRAPDEAALAAINLRVLTGHDAAAHAELQTLIRLASATPVG